MRYLRLILIVWLAIAVPTTAVASIVNADHCQRMQKSHATAGMDHAQHAMHMQLATEPMPMSHREHQNEQADNGCTCGCNCSNQHCTTGFTSLIGEMQISSDFFDGAAQQVARAEPGHLSAAHHLDLLRPPTLS